MDNFNFENYRKNLFLEGDELFLNYAATAPLSRVVIEKIKSETEAMRVPLGQRFYSALNNLEQSRRIFAEFVNVKGGEIAFTQNTSTAINTIAMAIDWQPGDRILVPDNEFPSNYYPWLNLKSRGVICEKFHPEKNVPLVETLKKINLSRVKLIAISAVSYETGRLYELQDFANFCQENKIYSFLDSIQALGAVPFDLKKIGADFAASGAQKWLMGPVGCGIIYAHEKHLSQLRVPYVGWTSVMYPENFDLGPLEYSGEMTRFEPGLPNYLSVIGMAESLVELKNQDWSQIYSNIKNNTSYLRKNISAMGFELLSDGSDLSAAITSFRTGSPLDHRQVEAAYHAEKIKITSRNNYVRVSPHFFNQKNELDRFLESTEKIFKKTKIKTIPDLLTIPDARAENKKTWILLTGATGNLGKNIAKILVSKNHSVHLQGHDPQKMQSLQEELKSLPSTADIIYDTVDFSDPSAVARWTSETVKNRSGQYIGLINCAGLVETQLFHETEPALLNKILEVNFSIPSQLCQLFLTQLKAPTAIGILNVVSSTGRCGSPLLAMYAASNAALWTLGESLASEWADQGLGISTFVAPAMHSPMQKRMGRVSLRFFKMTGSFNYDVPENVAVEIVKVFFEKRSLYISKLSRLKIFINSLAPEFILKKIQKVWRKN